MQQLCTVEENRQRNGQDALLAHYTGTTIIDLSPSLEGRGNQRYSSMWVHAFTHAVLNTGQRSCM